MGRWPLIVASIVVAWSLLFRVLKRKALRITLIVVGVVIALPLMVFSAIWAQELYMMWRARGVAAEVENYRASHGTYPISLSDIGRNDVNGPIYYDRDSNSPDAYWLWFGAGFGTMDCYNSKSRSWDNCYD